MTKRTKILIKILVLVLMPAFIVRPVVVSVYNSSLNLCAQQEAGVQGDAMVLGVHQASLHHVERESSESYSLVSSAAKDKTPLSLNKPIGVVSATVIPSPVSFFILRI